MGKTALQASRRRALTRGETDASGGDRAREGESAWATGSGPIWRGRREEPLSMHCCKMCNDLPPSSAQLGGSDPVQKVRQQGSRRRWEGSKAAVAPGPTRLVLRPQENLLLGALLR